MATTLTQENKEYVPSAWETVACPFCDSSGTRPHEKFGPDHRYTYVQCTSCDLVYANPRPKYDEEFIRVAYAVYDVENHHFKNEGALSSSERETVENHKIALQQIELHLGRKGRVLDIGCASGLFVLAAKELGWSAEGIDVSKEMTDQVRQHYGIPTYCGQYSELDVTRDGKFDVIYSSHVIEHIPNPNEWVRKFRQDLGADGIICLNIPNQFSLDRRYKRFLKRMGVRKDDWALWRTPDHLYEPHLKPMTFLLKKHGFQVLESFTYPTHEQTEPGFVGQIMHRSLKWGAKLRIIAKPLD